MTSRSRGPVTAASAAPAPDAQGPPAPCRRCGQPRPLELRMTARSGQVLQLVSCPRCETREWSADGRPITQEELYRLASGSSTFTLDPSRRR